MTEVLTVPFLKPDDVRQPLFFKDFSPVQQLCEKERVAVELQTEQEWFAGFESLALPTKDAVLGAVTAGELTGVSFDSKFATPTFGFSERQTNEQLQALPDEVDTSNFSIPFLRPRVLEVLTQVCREAYTVARQSAALPKGIDDFRFAVSSMTRTLNYQRRLVRNGVLAADPNKSNALSTHVYGFAFDIDHSGYYVEIDGVWTGVGLGRQEDKFMPSVIDALADTLQKYQESGVLKAICEVPMGRGCYHVAVRPEQAS